MFIGRASELEQLHTFYNANRLQLVFVQGEAQIGKTALLQQFLLRKKAAYFCVRHSLGNVNKASFYTELQEQGFTAAVDVTWQSALESICKKSLGEKLVLVLDDAQLLPSCFDGFLDFLSTLLAEYASRMRLLLIFAFRGNALLQSRELKNFKTYPQARIVLQPLPFLTADAFLTNFSKEERVLLYGVTGGCPCYLQHIDNTLPLKDNLQRLFYDEKALLLKEPLRILAESTREPAVYSAVLCSVACGAVRQKQIAEAVGMECNKLSKYLGVLLELGLLQRVVPVTEAESAKQHKRTYYRLANSMLEFWYQFVFPYLGSILLGKGRQIFRSRVFCKLDAYCSKVFRQICLQHCRLLLARKNFMFDYSAIGDWWDKELAPEDALILAYHGKKACFIGCCWERQKTDLEALAFLRGRAEGLDFAQTYYLLFSRKGFSDRLLSCSATDDNVRLISLQYLK